MNFGAHSQLEEATQIRLNYFIKNFAIIRPPQPRLGRHLWFHNFFHAAYFAWAVPFLQ